MRSAFACYKESSLDFMDCILAPHRLTEGAQILTTEHLHRKERSAALARD